jgi:large subunit ribosomal protein L18
MNKTSKKTVKRVRRHNRIRSTVKGTSDKPRLSVYKSNHALYAQIIDDKKGVTLAAASSKSVGKGTLTERANEMGSTLAKLATEKKISQVVFDRGGFAYTGVIASLADAARAGGLNF